MSVHDRLTLRSAYLYLVCLVTLVLAVFAAVNLVRDGVRLAYPDPGLYALEVAHGPDGGAASEEELARQRELALDSQRHQAVLGLVGSGAMLLIAGPVYLYHWRRVQAEHGTRREPVAASD